MLMLCPGCGKKEAAKKINKVSMVDAIREAAVNGDVKAQYDLGVCYANGVGVEKNPLEAFAWWNKAAENGYAQAQCELGSCYEKGFGTVIFTPMAIYWYNRAADQALASAYYNLGRCYAEGIGVAKSDYHAHYWYFLAAMQGHVKSMGEVGAAIAAGKVVAFNREAALFFLEKSRNSTQNAADAWERLNKNDIDLSKNL